MSRTEPNQPSGQPVDSSGIEAGKSLPGGSDSGIFGGGLDVYRTVTEDDYRALLTTGLIVLDANVLLNLYRYHGDTRTVLIEVLTRLRDRLWVPHQAMLEFFDNRLSVIDSRSEEIHETINLLEKNRDQLETGIRTWANRVGLPEDETGSLIGSIQSAAGRVADKIREQSSDSAFEHAEDTAEDPVIASLASILDRNVGCPLTEGGLREAKKEAKQRIIDKRPPGWKDASKRHNPEGDYIVWYQTLQEAKRRGADVLLVTGDVKDDWWRRERGETRGPLPELAYEMRAAADVRLFMLRPESLLVHAGRILGISVSSESVQDAKRVTTRDTADDVLEAAIQRLESSGASPNVRAAVDGLHAFGYVLRIAKTTVPDRVPENYLRIIDPEYTLHGVGYLTPSYFAFTRATDRERLLSMPGAEAQVAQVKFSHVESVQPGLMAAEIFES